MREVVQVAHSNSSSSKEETMIMSQLILVKRAPKARVKSKISHSISKSRNSNRFAKCTTISLAQFRLVFTHRGMRKITNSTVRLTISPNSQPTKPARKTTEVSNRTTTTTTKAITTMDAVAETITDSSRSKETSSNNNNLRITAKVVKQDKYKFRRKELRHQRLMKHSKSS